MEPFSYQSNNYPTPTRTITITLYKSELHNDIDSRTYKRGNIAMRDADLRAKDSYQSDATEAGDGMIIDRYCDLHDAQLRQILRFCLDNSDEPDSADDLNDNSESYVYKLKVPQNWSGSARTAAALMHEYIVSASLADWDRAAGVDASNAIAEAIDAQNALVSALRTPSRRRIPFQPWGPRERIYSDDDIINGND